MSSFSKSMSNTPAILKQNTYQTGVIFHTSTAHTTIVAEFFLAPQDSKALRNKKQNNYSEKQPTP